MTTQLTQDAHNWVGDEFFDSGKEPCYIHDDEYEYEYDEAEANENITECVAKKNFGFRDGIEEAAKKIETIVYWNCPDLLHDYSFTETRCNFYFIDFEVEINNADPVSVSAKSDHMSRPEEDSLRRGLRQTLSEALRDLSCNAYSQAIVLLSVIEEAAWHRREWLKYCGVYNRRRKHKAGWDASSVDDFSKVVDNPYGVDLSTVKNTAQHLLGQPISEILKDISRSLRVLHVEPVFRHDLAKKFLDRQKAIKADLMTCSAEELRQHIRPSEISTGKVAPSVEGMAEHLSKPHVTFHGAPRAFVSSIVRNGFTVPGHKIGSTGQTLAVRCGASFGVGIYSSPCLSYAALYGQGEYPRALHPGDVPGFRILVCATLMGRSFKVTRDATRRRRGPACEDAHSHISPGGIEYVVFKSSQIIPCYALHIDFGSHVARRHLQLVRNQPTRFLGSNTSRTDSDQDDGLDGPAARKAKAEALKARALKYLPYGFGPTTGTNFVIEEVADIDDVDEEEEFGEYQAIRGEHENEIERAQKANANTSWFDEYQTARKN